MGRAFAPSLLDPTLTVITVVHEVGVKLRECIHLCQVASIVLHELVLVAFIVAIQSSHQS